MLKWLFKQASEAKDESLTRKRLDELELQWRRMQEDWTDTYDKFRRLHMRVAKQVQRLEEASPDEGGTRPNGEEGGALADPRQPSLSERQRLINQQILQRRNRKES